MKPLEFIPDTRECRARGRHLEAAAGTCPHCGGGTATGRKAEQ
ncbi:hypothetical protein ACYJ1Y_13710 [Natrialbaceae archaeon A-gly3]